MSNSSNQLHPASRAMLVGAIVGGTASAASQWQSHKKGDIDTNQMVASVARDSLKAGLVSGATTYVADKMAGRPILSMLTILSASAAGLYLLDNITDKTNHE
ncbi:hypothetical protein ABT56_12965 [Photobacterium aquae]|uniref:Uncharacterized protein n=1 Tax=Photobacterium aquae TaxID=1195763 RepID=A0A0J1JS60_9GAMM|nr:magnetosome protein MamC [Photobacterium aquae]KLV05102.1 hypothetical protein ABT56_12965 [Photobacterium aquae]